MLGLSAGKLDSSQQRSRSYSHEKPMFMAKVSCKMVDAHEVDFPFRPQISELPTDLYRNRSKIEVSKDEQLERLMDNRQQELDKRLKDRLRYQQEEFEKHCTFQPQINRTVLVDSQEEVHRRLYEEGIERLKYRQMSRSVEKENYSFQPNVNKQNILNSEKLNLQPLYKRLAEEISKEHDYRQMLKRNAIAAELEECQPVRPNTTSERIIASKPNFCRDVVERLMNEVRQRQRRRQHLVENYEAKQMQQLTFTPEINPVSLELTESVSFKEDFVKRQEQLTAELKLKMERRAKDIFQQENITFKPSINKVSEMLANMQRINEDDQQRIQRLHQDFEVVKKVHIQQLESETYKECTFQPCINHISKMLEANPVQHCCDRPAPQQFNFRPEINGKSRQLARNVSNSRKTDTTQLQLEKVKMELEYQRMKQCTFKPKIKQYVSKSQKCLAEIGGINTFIRVAQNKRKKEQEQKETEQRLFNLEKRYDQRPQKLTKVEQFNLSKPNSKAKQELKQEQQKLLEKECPFRPNVNRKRLL